MTQHTLVPSARVPLRGCGCTRRLGTARGGAMGGVRPNDARTKRNSRDAAFPSDADMLLGTGRAQRVLRQVPGRWASVPGSTGPETGARRTLTVHGLPHRIEVRRRPRCPGAAATRHSAGRGRREPGLTRNWSAFLSRETPPGVPAHAARLRPSRSPSTWGCVDLNLEPRSTARNVERGVAIRIYSAAAMRLAGSRTSARRDWPAVRPPGVLVGLRAAEAGS